MGDDRQMKKIRVGILGVAAAAALCFTAGAVYLYARGVWQMPIPADRALPVLMYHHIVEDGEPCNDMTITVSRMEQDQPWLTEHGYRGSWQGESRCRKNPFSSPLTTDTGATTSCSSRCFRHTR